MTAGPKRRIFNVRGGHKLVSDTWGSPDDRAVMLLHGGGQTRHSWSGTAAALAREGWYAVSLDLRGHGESDWSKDGQYGFEVFRDDAADVARCFPRPPVLVGASLGGVASLLALHEYGQDLAAALVLVDIATRMEPEGVKRIVDFMMQKPEGFDSLEEVADAIASYNPHRKRPKDLRGLEKNLRRDDAGRWHWHWDPRFLNRTVHQEHLPNQEAGPAHDMLEAAARALTVPTLLVRGVQSDVLSADGADDFRKLAPHAHFADISGAGHMVAGDRNDVFSQAAIEFLGEHVADKSED